MRSYTRRLAAATSAALLVAGVAVPPSTAGVGPVVIDDHDSHIPPRAYEISSSTGGTVYATDDGGFGRVHLSPAPMTFATPIDLGPRPRTHMPTTISGSRVAVPQPGSSWDTPVTVVRSCVIGICPTMSTRTLPAGWRYVGNADDRAVVFHSATNKLGLLEWTGSNAVTNEWTMPVTYAQTPSAVGDLTGVAVSGGGEITFVNRTANSVHYLDYGDGAVLTPTSIVWHAVGVGEPADETRIYRVLRSTTDANPAPVTAHTLFGAPAIEQLAANDFGAAWTVPNGDSEGTSALWSATWDGAPVRYARDLTTSGLSNFEATNQVLVNDRRAGIPGLYKITPGSYSGSLAGLAPTRGAVTYDVAVSNGRAMYVDDMTENLPLFTRTVTDGAPGPESMFTSATAGQVALSGPYVAFTRPTGSAGSVNVVYGRTDSVLTTRSFAEREVGRIEVSGRRLLLTGGERARVIDMVTGAMTDLGRSYAAIFGEYVGLINYDTGAVTRRNLDTGSVQVVRIAEPGCTSECVDDDNWQLALWGHELVYSFGHSGSSAAVVSGLWNGNSGGTTALSMLSSAAQPLYTEIAYWGGLLLVAHNDATVRLYDMRSGTPGEGVLVDGFAEEPFAMDGNVVAWRPLSNLKAVVRDVRDFVPGFAASPRYLDGVVPAGFGPDTAAETWKPSFLVSQEMTGTLQIREGSASGAIVKSIPVGTLNGELTGLWDGTTADASDAPQGTYFWTIEVGGISPTPLQRASGVSVASGTVYLSRTPLGAPGLTAPARSTDVSASTSFPVSWTPPAGVPAGTRYVLQRSVNGGAFADSTTTTATSLSYGGAPGTTYRFRVAALDAAGRRGSYSAVRTTVVPFNDNATGTVYGGVWRTGLHGSLYGGSHRYSSAPGATYTFKATGTAIYLIGTRSTNYGQFQVSIDGGAYSGLIDSHASSLQLRRVLYSRSGLSNATHTIKVRVYGTRGRPNIGIDGVGFLR